MGKKNHILIIRGWVADMRQMWLNVIDSNFFILEQHWEVYNECKEPGLWLMTTECETLFTIWAFDSLFNIS